MVSYKLDKYDKYFVAFILVILTIFNIGQCFASEVEDVNIDIANGLIITENNNFFTSSSNNSVGYFEIEKGYIYHIYNSNKYYIRRLACSNSAPAVNVTYDYIGVIQPDSYYSFISNDNEYLYFDFTTASSDEVTVTREKIAGQSSAVSDLVQSVGPHQLWSVFESGIDFIGVVVLVAFGLFLIVLLVKKLSKGKSDF